MRASRSRPRQHTLPADLTSFVGRRRELATVKQLLADSRLVTLTGPGGVGKTRLALRAASELARAFPDGAWLVELGGLENSSLVASTVARTLGLLDESARWLPATLSDHLADKRLLLVLDNCEHLLSATAVLADTLLRAAPGLRIMATSREALGITGEANFGVPSLSLPDASEVPALERLVQYEAVTLFEERARAIDPTFRLTVSNRRHVVDVCRRLDGIPLAIELSAVRLRTLSIEELGGRLDDAFRVLTQGSRTALPRQQTLRGTIEWSWNLLSEREKVLWRRLSVFASGFDHEAVEAVAADDMLPVDSIEDALVGLIDKSLVGRGETYGRTRYTMLETFRQFARDKAREAAEIDWLSTRHLDWYARLCEMVAPALRGPQRQACLDRLDSEFSNLQVALERARLTEKDAETGLMMITRTFPFWQTRGHRLEGRHWLAGLLAVATSPTPARLRGLDALAYLSLSLGAGDEARTAVAEGLSFGDQLDDAEALAGILTRQGYLAMSEGDVATAIASYRRAGDIYRRLGDRGELGRALRALGSAFFGADDLASAEPVTREGIDLASDPQNRGHGETVLGWILVAAQRYPEAEEAFREALAARDDIDRLALGLVFGGLAYLEVQRRRPERAAVLMGAVDGIWKQGRPSVPRKMQQAWADAESLPRTELGEERYQRARGRGQTMQVEEAFEFATQRGSVSAAPSPSRPARSIGVSASRSGLSRRELEVASLVAEGMSNKEIASRLILSERTIDHHVAHILDKLGFNSRAQVAVWAAKT